VVDTLHYTRNRARPHCFQPRERPLGLSNSLNLMLFDEKLIKSKSNISYIILHRVSKNVQLTCYNFDADEWIFILFGRNVTNKVGNQKTLYCATLNNLCFCTTWQNAET